MRQIVLDTETTGLDPNDGHRIIEIGCVELIDRRLTGNNFHQYIQPDRDIDKEAFEVHGISNEFLLDKPRFADIATDFLKYIGDSELIIHNAAFDIGFLNAELERIDANENIGKHCEVIDTLEEARKKLPGKRLSLDALCKHYAIDNSHRTLHGALLDAEILADVYLAMTGGQSSLELANNVENKLPTAVAINNFDIGSHAQIIIKASESELAAHEQMLEQIINKAGFCMWDKLANNDRYQQYLSAQQSAPAEDLVAEVDFDDDDEADDFIDHDMQYIQDNF